MKTIIKKGDLIKGLPFKWNMEIHHIKEGAYWRACKDNRISAEINFQEGELTVSIVFSKYLDQPVQLSGNAQEGDSALICNTGNRIALYINSVTADEDWPLGEADLNGAICFDANIECWIHDDFSFYEKEKKSFKPEEINDVMTWRPKGRNTSIGDCMPFSHGGMYRLFYLFDRRHHKSKWGLGAHQWGQIITRDFKTWQTCPMAISIDEQYEGSICTGSVIEHNDNFYAFYAVRMSDRSPARLTYAVSRDCVHFQKSGEYITLRPPYEPVSARDPKVFSDDQGLFHMLVTTSVNGRGALAHLVSDNLQDWIQREPFIILDNAAQPECPDYFKFGDYYYLLYGIHGAAHYFYSRNPFGPWAAPVDNIVAHKKLRVPKAAVLNERLVFAGFIADSDGNYGGHIELYEAKPACENNGRLVFQLLK